MKQTNTIRRMQLSDIEFAAQLTFNEGWIGENRETFDAFLTHDPKGCFVAVKSKKRIGICIATPYQQVGFIGELIVVEDERGLGIGRALLDYSIAYLKKKGIKSIYLDGVPAAISLYERAGFQKICRSLRFKGHIQSESYPHIRQMKPEDLQIIQQMDKKIFGEDRSFFLQIRLSNHPELCLAMEKQDRLVGFIFARNTKKFISMGPWWNHPDVEFPESLPKHLMQKIQGVPLRIGVLETNLKAVRLLRSLGLEESSDSPWRMVLGPEGNLGMSDQLYAIGSAAKG